MRTMIAIPCGDFLPVGFMRSVIGSQITDDNVQFMFAQGSLVYDARNKLANFAIDNGFDRVLWLDSDMEFGPDLYSRLKADMDDGREYVSGLYFTRKDEIMPVAYSAVYIDRDRVPRAEPIKNWPSEIFEVAATGFGAVMCSVDLMKRIRDKYGLPFSPILGFGEDLSFCLRAKDLGAKMYCDPRVELGHIGQRIFTKNDYHGGN